MSSHNSTPPPQHTNQAWMQRDLNVLWHPCTQMKDHETLPVIPVKKGYGVWLEDFEGNRYLDAVSSWWVNLFGHCNPYINQKIKSQIDQLEHAILAGFSHEPIITLSERLVEITPPGLNKCFYADNGSSCVEVALKMSFHYWKNVDDQRRSNGGKNPGNVPVKSKFICLSNSYHGETLATLSVSDVALYKETYQPLLMESITVPSPDCFHREPGVDWETHSIKMFAEMERTLEAHAHDVAGVAEVDGDDGLWSRPSHVHNPEDAPPAAGRAGDLDAAGGIA